MFGWLHKHCQSVSSIESETMLSRSPSGLAYAQQSPVSRKMLNESVSLASFSAIPVFR